MTAIIRYAGTTWDATLPKLPRPAPSLGFTPNHEYNATRLTQPLGTAVVSWADLRGTNPMENAIGGILRTQGNSQYVEFSGVSGSLLAAIPASSVRTVIALARVDAGDVVGGSGPIVSTNTDGVVQADADEARPRNSTTALLPAARGKWHVYAYSIPAEGNGVFVVDSASAAFAPLTRSATSLALALGNSERRQVRVAHVLTAASALTASQIMTAAAELKAYYSDLNFA